MSLTTKITGLKEIWRFDNRCQLLLTRLFFRRERINVYRLRGMNILVDYQAGDANGAREVIASPMYRQFLPSMDLGPAVNVLDIGANNGGFPLLLRAEDVALKRVVSVELNPNTFQRLRFNLETNAGCEVTCVNAALCGESRELEVMLGAGSTHDSIYHQGAGDGARLYRIPGMTFDEIYSAHFGDDVVDVCKMDVEGAEYETFSEPNHEKVRRCRYLIIEIHDDEPSPPSEVIHRLQQLNFVEQQVSGDDGPSVHCFVNSDLAP